MHNNQKYKLHKCASLTEWINIHGILHNGIVVDLKRREVLIYSAS